MEHIAIQGTFADLKSVKTRSVVQMVVEIPIEQAEAVVKAFGFPQPGAEIAVAVARLDVKADKPPTTAPEWVGREAKKPFKDYTLAQQSGMRCGDEMFRRWACWKFNPTAPANHSPDVEWAANQVRAWCNVDSRSEFDTNADAGKRWLTLNAEFEEWNGMTAEQR